jgi:hypothetical protein
MSSTANKDIAPNNANVLLNFAAGLLGVYVLGKLCAMGTFWTLQTANGQIEWVPDGRPDAPCSNGATEQSGIRRCNR